MNQILDSPATKAAISLNFVLLYDCNFYNRFSCIDYYILLRCNLCTFWPDSLCFVLWGHIKSWVFYMKPYFWPHPLPQICCYLNNSVLAVSMAYTVPGFIRNSTCSVLLIITLPISCTVCLCLSLSVSLSLSLSLSHVVIIYYQILIICHRIGLWKIVASS